MTDVFDPEKRSEDHVADDGFAVRFGARLSATLGSKWRTNHLVPGDGSRSHRSTAPR